MTSKSIQSMTAVCVGATAGIGRGFAKYLAETVARPNITIVGRSKVSGDAVLAELKAINEDGVYTFKSCDVSLVANVDELCPQLPKEINLLVLSQGMIDLSFPKNAEDNDIGRMLQHYTRLLFASKLVPNLQAAASAGQPARVISVLNSRAGKPSDIMLDNQMATGTSFLKIKQVLTHVFAQHDAAWSKAAQLYPNVAFIHAYPSYVTTDFVKGLPWIMRVFGSIFGDKSVLPIECAHRMLATVLASDRYTAGAFFVDEHGMPYANKPVAKPEVLDAVWQDFEKVTQASRARAASTSDKVNGQQTK